MAAPQAALLQVLLPALMTMCALSRQQQHAASSQPARLPPPETHSRPDGPVVVASARPGQRSLPVFSPQPLRLRLQPPVPFHLPQMPPVSWCGSSKVRQQFRLLVLTPSPSPLLAWTALPSPPKASLLLSRGLEAKRRAATV